MSGLLNTAQNALTTAKGEIASHASALSANKKDRQMESFRVHHAPGKTAGLFGGCPYMTSNTGFRVHNTDEWLHAGERGPALLMDQHGREKIVSFDHERIPERVVHARGAGAWGEFKLHTAIPEFSHAEVLNNTHQTVPMFVRFSTVLGSRGSADTVRDVRGFACRFFTEQGNWDVVGNNIPIFFIQDGMKFPDIIHAGKPEPHNEIPQAQSAHDNFYDFVSLAPETSAMVMWALSDRTIPRSYRMMNGFGVNTYCLVNKKNERHFVKFHWRPKQGLHSLVWDEALKLNGQDPDFHRRDLWTNIENGNYPEWEFGVQVLPESREHDFDFDILDATKFWPEEDVPVKYIGTFKLNRNPDEYFTETEQIAFCTSNIVPGVDFSDDPLLQIRNFSYLDTQLLRLGGPNFNEIPINQPICRVDNNQRDGLHRQRVTTGKVNYWPNRYEVPKPASLEAGGLEHYPAKVEGVRQRARPEKWKVYYNQATMFWNSLTDVERGHIVAAASFELGKVEDERIKVKMIERFNEIHHDFAAPVALNIGLECPPAKAAYYSKRTDGVSQLRGINASALGTPAAVATRIVGVLAFDGFDAGCVAAVRGGLKLAGTVTPIIGNHGGNIKSSGSEITDGLRADFTVDTARSTHVDALVIASGAESIRKMSKNGVAIHWVREAYKHQKPILVVGPDACDFVRNVCLREVPLKLADTAGAANDGENVVEDQGVVSTTSIPSQSPVRSLADVPKAIKQFLEQLSHHRIWSRDVAIIAA